MKTLVASPQQKSGKSNHHLFIQKKDDSGAANTFFSPKESMPDSSESVYLQADSDDCVHSGGCDNPGPSDDEVHGEESPPEEKEDKEEDNKETPDKEPETTEEDAPKKGPYQEILDTSFKFKHQFITKKQLTFMLAYFIKGAKILNSKKLDGGRAVLMVGQAGQESSYAKKGKGNPNVKHHNYLGWQPIEKEQKELKDKDVAITKEDRGNGPHGSETPIPNFKSMDQAIELGLDIAFGLEFEDAVHKNMGKAFKQKDGAKSAQTFSSSSGTWNQNSDYKRTLMNEIHRSRITLIKILKEIGNNDSLSSEAKSLVKKLTASLNAIVTFHTKPPKKK